MDFIRGSASLRSLIAALSGKSRTEASFEYLSYTPTNKAKLPYPPSPLV